MPLIFSDKVLKALKHPVLATQYLFDAWRGFHIKIRYEYILRRAKIGKKVRVRGKCIIRGPGKIIIGDHVFINGDGHPVTLFTHHQDARIIIGSHTFLNGPRFGCQVRITVGDYNILGDARIMDTDFHSIHPDRWSHNAEVLSAPVTLERNVWVGGGAAILKGVTVGQNSVLAFGSIVSDEVPANCVVAGNPARIVKRLAVNGT